jgi:hypothetical protein
MGKLRLVRQTVVLGKSVERQEESHQALPGRKDIRAGWIAWLSQLPNFLFCLFVFVLFFSGTGV